MKTPRLLRALALTVLSALAGAAFASRSVELVDPGRTQLVALDDSQPATPADVRRAILLGSQARRWVAVGEQPGVLTLQMDNDQHLLLVDVAFDAQGFEIKYKSSANLNFHQEGNRMTIHPTAVRWIHELGDAIHKAALAPRP